MSKHDLRLPWKIEGDGYWVNLVRSDQMLAASPMRRPEALAVLRWQRASLKAEAARRARPADPGPREEEA